MFEINLIFTQLQATSKVSLKMCNIIKKKCKYLSKLFLGKTQEKKGRFSKDVPDILMIVMMLQTLGQAVRV